MPDARLGNPLDVVDKRYVQGQQTSVIATPANYKDTTALKARLTAISATNFTAARLASMTYNDMVYALRLTDDPGV